LNAKRKSSRSAATLKLWMQGSVNFVAELEEEKGFNTMIEMKVGDRECS
jgi:hypothetical protein